MQTQTKRIDLTDGQWADILLNPDEISEGWRRKVVLAATRLTPEQQEALEPKAGEKLDEKKLMAALGRRAPLRDQRHRHLRQPHRLVARPAVPTVTRRRPQAPHRGLRHPPGRHRTPRGGDHGEGRLRSEPGPVVPYQALERCRWALEGSRPEGRIHPDLAVAQVIIATGWTFDEYDRQPARRVDWLRAYLRVSAEVEAEAQRKAAG